MKNLVIKDAVSMPERVYEFILSFMHGDADGYSTEEIIVSQDNPMVQEFANFLASLKGRESADKMHGEFFAKLEENEEMEEILDELHFDYPYDNTSDYSHPASCQGLEIFYYDEMGVKFSVKLED